MEFYEVVGQAAKLLQQQGRLTYRTLRRQFNLDDEALEDLKDELLFSHPVVDEDGRGLVWTGESGTKPEPVSTPPAQPEVTQEDQPTQIEAPPTEPHTPDAERRQLTVMFSDLVDSTKLSGQLDPEDYREIVRAYQATCAEVIHRFEGYIAQHLGDALLVYFGFPQAHEDDAQRAIRAGLGMLEAMKSLNTRLEQDTGIRLAIRVGIHTGLTVIGDIGEQWKHEHLAMGETPNIAARIQGAATPDAVAISDATYRLVQGYFACQDMGEQRLKGVAEPMQIYRVLQASSTWSRLDIARARGLTPLVGREQEVGLLLERWHQVKEGQGQVVLLSGEGGIGKSRLLQVLKEHVADAPYTRWECRSSPYFQNTALYPITELFQQTLRFQADDTPEQRLAKLEQALSPYRVPVEESVPLFAPLLSLAIPEDRYPPLNLSPQRQRQRTLETILTVVMGLSEQQPVLFILEDLHWTDPSTLELLDLLIDQTPTTPICVLLTCRPTFQPTWSHRSYLTEVTVNRLSGNQIERLAEQVAGGKSLPAEVLERIVERTDGVPLFIEEFVKVILESGHLQESSGRYELTGTLPALAIPATLQDSLMARLDRLVTAKGIAQLCAVLGRTFTYDLLQAVSPVDEDILQRELRQLVEVELVYHRGLPPHATYTFKHALIRDAAYESLLKSTRQQYHQRIALTLAERFPETTEHQPELLAHHLTEAGLNAQAVDYWHKAGAKAIQRSAHVEAIAHLRTGLALLKTLPETPERVHHELDMLLILGPALMAMKSYAAAEVEHTYGRARALCQQMEDSSQLFPILWGLWLFYLIRVDLQAAQELGEQLLTLAQRGPDTTRLVEAHYALGSTLNYVGELTAAQAHLDQGLILYHAQQHPFNAFHYGYDAVVGCLSYAALTLWCLGYPDRALAKNHEALRLAQELAHLHSLAFALCFAAWFHCFRREGQSAQEQAEAAMRLASEQGFTHWSAMARVQRGWALAAQGQSGQGIAHIRQGLAAWQATGARAGGPSMLMLLADAHGKAEQPEAGLATLAEALALVQDRGERRIEAELHRLNGVLLLSQSPDNHAEAERCFHEALSVARSQQAKSFELRAATNLSRLWQQQGKRQDAYDLLASVYGWFTEGFDTLDLKEAKALLEELSQSR